MATFEKRGTSWQARVCVRRHRESATFPDLGRAKAWAARVETELRAQARGEIVARSVRQALERYAEHVSPTHRGERWERIRLAKLARTLPFRNRRMQDVGRPDVTAWRDALLETLATSSARREFGLLRAVFALAVREWGWLHRSPFEGVTPPPEGLARSQRVSDTEIAIMCAALGYEPGIKPERASQYIGAAIVLAVGAIWRACGNRSCRNARFLSSNSLCHITFIPARSRPRSKPPMPLNSEPTVSTAHPSPPSRRMISAHSVPS